MYQGREAKHYIQAPTEDQLDEMIEGLNEYAVDHGMDSIEVLQRRPDPDGGWEATIVSHNFNFGSALRWVKEKFRPTREFDIESGELVDVEPEEDEVEKETDPKEKRRVPGFAGRLWERYKEEGEEWTREREEEEAFKGRRKKGEVGPDVLSSREQREQTETTRRMAEEAAKAAASARKGERQRAPKYAREAVEASEEAKKAEERAKLLETELYGTPHVNPVEVIRDRWGRETGRVPLAGKRRLEAIKLEAAQKRMTERGIGLMEERFKVAEEAIREKRVAKRRSKITGPARDIAKGIAGVVESVGRTGAGFGVRTEPYRMRPPALIPTPRTTTFRSPEAGPVSPGPKSPDLSALRRLQTQGVPSGPSLFPAGQTTRNKKPRKKNTFDVHLRQMRRRLFGG